MGEKKSQFEELLLTQLDGAYNVAFWLAQNDRVAQAIVEEAYRQAMREFEKLREPHARVWLLTIVLKVAHARIQGWEGRPTVIPFAANDTTEEANATKIPPDVLQNESERSFFKVLSGLPLEFREILLLHEVEGWSYQQLAAALQTTRDTNTTRLSVARRSLREKLWNPRSSVE